MIGCRSESVVDHHLQAQIAGQDSSESCPIAIAFFIVRVSTSTNLHKCHDIDIGLARILRRARLV
jgi:hypothetical protein